MTMQPQPQPPLQTEDQLREWLSKHPEVKFIRSWRGEVGIGFEVETEIKRAKKKEKK